MPGFLSRIEDRMDGETPVENSDDQEEQEDREAAAERRRERRAVIVQLLIDWSSVIAAVANLVVQHFS
ncbi:hypothetical protein GCM10018980_71100 [Streptomyces capoamus]|uniref:Uncharacterized protein n=2 Tax=Streptomyces capoamus TaxID=68183 RepID=A0A919KG02_9ACTN|nr:hypothetical protein GCM10010501_16130 [Streptomyces libani subsp. rufus]GHG74302.1 hypothetical protein GCM10018980_71100 [Streptomyces capoamus]